MGRLSMQTWGGGGVRTVKEPWEVGLMRNSGRRLAEVVALLKESVEVGMTTLDLDTLAEQKIRSLGATPNFLGYEAGPTPYPASICASVNAQVVHGIPNDRPLKAGDVVSIDVGLVYGGYHADCAFSVVLDDHSDDARSARSAEVARLLDVTEKSLYEGIAQAVPGNRIGDIGHAVQSFVEPHGFGIIREYVGHGIGRLMHETPSVPNYGKPGRGLLLKPGMCLAIEPMITMGGHQTKVLRDGWTVVTRDGSLAAHFEHTIAVTPTGPEVLTVLEGQTPLG